MLGFIPIGSVLTIWFGYLLISLFTFKIGSFTFWQPYPKTSYQIQVSGDIKTDLPVKVFILDGYKAPQAIIDKLHDANKKVICQVSLGTVVKGTEDFNVLTEEMIGRKAIGDSVYVDIKSPTVMKVIENRLVDMSKKKCDGIDGTDAQNWNEQTGFTITKEDQIRYNVWIVNKAHEYGLSMGLHNDADQVTDLVDYYDFAVNDECVRLNECEKYLPFVENNKAVFTVEYTGNKDEICPYANEMELSVVFKSPQLGSEYQACQ